MNLPNLKQGDVDVLAAVKRLGPCTIDELRRECFLQSLNGRDIFAALDRLQTNEFVSHHLRSVDKVGNAVYQWGITERAVAVYGGLLDR